MFGFKRDKWILIKDSGKYKYYENEKKDKRKYVEYSKNGYQPLDSTWLKFHEIRECPICGFPTAPKNILSFECFSLTTNINIFNKEDYIATHDCSEHLSPFGCTNKFYY